MNWQRAGRLRKFYESERYKVLHPFLTKTIIRPHMKVRFIIFFALVFVFSCSTDNQADEVEQNQEELTPNDPVSEMEDEEDEPVSENQDEEATTYLSEISSNVSLTTEENSFDFTDFDNIFSLNQNGELESWEIDFVVQTTKFEFQSESGNITKLTTTDVDVDTQESSTDETFIEYDSNGRIIKIETFFNGEKLTDYEIVHNESDIDFVDLIDDRDRTITVDQENNISSFFQEGINFSIVFEYTNGNLTRKTLNGDNILTYTYDDSLNPFNAEIFLNFSTLVNYLNVIAGWEFLFYDENNIFSNPNNLMVFTVENNSFGGLDDQSFSYEYNTENLPTRKSNGDNSIVVEYIYPS